MLETGEIVQLAALDRSLASAIIRTDDRPARRCAVTTFSRGDGVGIEFTRQLVRGVRLDAESGGRADSGGRGGDRRLPRRPVGGRRVRSTSSRAGRPDRSHPNRHLPARQHAAPHRGDRAYRCRTQHVAGTTPARASRWPRRCSSTTAHDGGSSRSAGTKTRSDASRHSPSAPVSSMSPSSRARWHRAGRRRPVTRARRDAAVDESFESHGCDRDSRWSPPRSSRSDAWRHRSISSTAEFSTGWFDDIAEPAHLVAELRTVRRRVG